MYLCSCLAPLQGIVSVHAVRGGEESNVFVAFCLANSLAPMPPKSALLTDEIRCG